jgi:hypothetical protein
MSQWHSIAHIVAPQALSFKGAPGQRSDEADPVLVIAAAPAVAGPVLALLIVVHAQQRGALVVAVLALLAPATLLSCRPPRVPSAAARMCSAGSNLSPPCTESAAAERGLRTRATLAGARASMAQGVWPSQACAGSTHDAQQAGKPWGTPAPTDRSPVP